MFNLKGPQGQNPSTTCGPRTTVWETLSGPHRACYGTLLPFFTAPR